jgi:hypothetical protein
MIGAFEAEGPSVGIFWMVETGLGEARLLTAGCLLEAAEPYGDCLTFADGHYDVWARWRKARGDDRAVQGLVRSYEYEDWPRGRIVFDQTKGRFILYADRKLLLPETLALIRKRFSIAAEDSVVETDYHYQRRETPGAPA